MIRFGNKKQFTRALMATLLMVGLYEQTLLSSAHAAAASGYIRLDRLGTSAVGGALVCMTPQTTATEGKVVLTFPGTGSAGSASFGVAAAGSWTTTTTGIPSGTSAWSVSSPVVSTNTVTFTSPDLTVGTTYCFIVTGNALTNPSSAASGNTLTGSIQTQTSGASAIDTVNNAYAIISNDQISVTAAVPQSFTFSLGSNAAALGTLTLGSTISSSGIVLTAITNAQQGWQAWVKSTNGALSSAGTGGSITSAQADLSSASNGYGLVVSATAGNAVADASTYALGGTTVGSLATTYKRLGYYSSGPSATSGDQLTLTVKAKADSSIKAASDYSDTLTVTGAGSF